MPNATFCVEGYGADGTHIRLEKGAFGSGACDFLLFVDGLLPTTVEQDLGDEIVYEVQPLGSGYLTVPMPLGSGVPDWNGAPLIADQGDGRA